MQTTDNNSPIWDHLDYRGFLLSFYETKKRASRGRFSYRVFSNKTGVQSPNYLKLIVDGSRNLTLPHARRVAKFCGLSAEETQYFLSLVKWNQAGKQEEASELWSQVLKLRSRAKRLELSSAQLGIVTDLNVIALFELLQVEQKSLDKERLAKRLNQSVKDVEAGLALLEKAQLIRGNKVLNKTLKSADDVPSKSIRQYHHQALEAARKALESTAVEEREYISTTLTVKKSDLPKLKEQIRALRDQMLSSAEAAAGAEEVYQLNVQLFPLTKSVEEES